MFDDEEFKLDERLFFKNNSILDGPEDWPATVQRVDTVIGEPFYQELVCVREMPFLAHHYRFLKSLEDAYEKEKLTKDFICPHRGYLTFATDKSKTGCARICPGHRLGWNKDGNLQPRCCS